MLCDFLKLDNIWVCEKCGRKVKVKQTDKFMPTAQCRIPEHYKYTNDGFMFNQKILGVGDTLSQIIKAIGYGYSPVGKTRAKITYLNKKGIDWCEKNQKTILKWIEEECISYNIQYLELAVKSILRLAIRKARRYQYNN